MIFVQPNHPSVFFPADGLGAGRFFFSNTGFDLKNMLRNGSTDSEIREKIIQIWEKREDRYSELRQFSSKGSEKIEMSYIGG